VSSGLLIGLFIGLFNSEEGIMATSNRDKGGTQDQGSASGARGNKQASTGSGNQGSTKSRGFASMDPARQRAIASEGGKAAHQKGTAHEFTSEEARRAGSMSHGNRQSEAGSGSGAAASPGNAGGAASERGGERGSEQGSEPDRQS
jgi:hypothetical protein